MTHTFSSTYGGREISLFPGLITFAVEAQKKLKQQQQQRVFRHFLTFSLS